MKKLTIKIAIEEVNKEIEENEKETKKKTVKNNDEKELDKENEVIEENEREIDGNIYENIYEDKDGKGASPTRSLSLIKTITLSIPPHVNTNTVYNSLLQTITNFIGDNNLDGSLDPLPDIDINEIDDSFNMEDFINQCIEDSMNFPEE